MKTIFVVLCVALLGTSGAAGQSADRTPIMAGTPSNGNNPTGRPFFHHAYYLFLEDPPHGCEACYVPLLITTVPLETAARSQGELTGALIITYERDSVWQMAGAAPLSSKLIDPAARKINVHARNYRYQEISAAELLRLLRNPMGTIPISRPLLVNQTAPGATPEELVADFSTIFRIRERRSNGVVVEDGKPKTAPSSYTALLTVFDHGKFQYQRTLDCFHRTDWNCPAGSAQQRFDGQLSLMQLEKLGELLDTQAVQNASSFINEAPISNDYEIEIPRPAGVQDIQALAFMPDHVELHEHPALLYLVCRAKEIAHLGSITEEIPQWCSGLPPLK